MGLHCEHFSTRTVLARAGLQNLCSLKVLHGIAGNQIFGERLDATARSLNDYPNYFLAAWTTTSSTSRRPERLLRLLPGDRSWFVGLHCEHFPALTSFDYIKQGQSNSMSIPAGDGTTGASGTGPALEYTLKLKCFILFIFFVNLEHLHMLRFTHAL